MKCEGEMKYASLDYGHMLALWYTVRPQSENENDLSEVGFEPTPGEPDCDLNAAP